MRIGDRHVREMAARFEEIDKRFDLMRWIDSEIVSNLLSLDQAFSRVLYRSAACMGASAASAFVIVDDTARLFAKPPKTFENIDPLNIPPHHLLAAAAVDIVTDDSLGVAYLIIPVQSQTLGLKIILVLQAAWFGGATSVFHQEDLRDFATMVARQCEIMAEKKIQFQFNSVRHKISQSYFEYRSDPQRCWLEIAKDVLEFLPPWKSIGLRPLPQAQILTYDGNLQTVHLRAGTDQDSPAQSRELLIKKTVSGLLVEMDIDNRQAKPLLLDPSQPEYAQRYSQFLFEDDIPKSELMVPIFELGGDKLIGLINVEHPKAHIFSDIHIKLFEIAAVHIAPFVNALTQEEQAQRARDRNHLYTLHNILSKMSKTYKHKLAQHTQIARSTLELLQSAKPKLDEEERGLFRDLTEAVFTFTELSEGFAASLPNYVYHGPMYPLTLVQNAVDQFKAKKLQGPNSSAANPDIDIHVENQLDPDIRIFASPMLTEYIYNILNNSMISIGERLRLKQIGQGRIEIQIKSEPQTDRRNKENSYAFVLIEIRDNGGGLTKEAERLWGVSGHTTRADRGGTGFGVPSTIDYMAGLGGRVEKENDPGKGLTVILYVPEYVAAVHGPRAAQLGFGGSQRLEDSK